VLIREIPFLRIVVPFERKNIGAVPPTGKIFLVSSGLIIISGFNRQPFSEHSQTKPSFCNTQFLFFLSGLMLDRLKKTMLSSLEPVENKYLAHLPIFPRKKRKPQIHCKNENLIEKGVQNPLNGPFFYTAGK
jgi:hypothetical protein